MENNVAFTSPFISKIESDNYEIISSGSLILFKANSKLTFTIDDLAFEIVFKKSDKQEIILDASKDDLKKFSIICNGFDNALGTSTQYPLHILNYNGYDVYFSFVAFNMSKIPYIVYTFYRGSKNEQ